MNPRYLPVVDGLLLIALFVGAPSISAAIGYLAWKGRPQGFGRERYGLSAIAVGLPAFALMAYTQRMDADVRTPQYLLQLACFACSTVLLGIAGGCFVGVFTCRRENS
ncbi:MAG TPA: hypothetical protein VKR59_15110 [Terriglobales bacterium]|nr:hypothetical protein [Terriglobales bacterium]